MKTKIKYGLGAILTLLLIVVGCTQDNYTLGSLIAPSSVVINAEIVGQGADNPNGDGSGNVVISVTASDALAYKIDYGTSSSINLVALNGTVTKKYTNTGVHDYRITVVAYGRGGSSSVETKDITVRSDFNVAPQIATDLTNNSSKAWVVDKSVPGHMGVAPWDPSVTSPIWWSANVNEKVGCCNCFYTSTFTFSKNITNNTYSLVVNSPDGAFTKTGSLAGGLPGIPASGSEGCYTYAGGTSAFSFVPSSSGIATGTHTGILLVGTSTYIGYGATQKEYEILEITPTYLYLRVQGTETGNSWYLKLKPAV